MTMLVEIDTSALRRTKWYEYAVRFFFGGLITAAAGLIAKQWGPVAGGIFLAFPAIFPASATLIEKHEREKKEKAGVPGVDSARKAVSVDAAGAAIGSIGLFVFALLVWRFLPNYDAPLILSSATVAWLGVSVLIWWIRKRI
jgi:hypothetical protein